MLRNKCVTRGEVHDKIIISLFFAPLRNCHHRAESNEEQKGYKGGRRRGQTSTSNISIKQQTTTIIEAKHSNNMKLKRT